MVLSRHYSLFHDIITKSPIYEALTVTFIEQSGFRFLDTCEYRFFATRKRDPSSCEVIILVYLGCAIIFPFNFADLIDLSYHPRRNQYWRFSS